MKISIIIPCFNVENTLNETIESVQKQCDVNYELIVIDDGSTDLTREIIKSYGEKLIAVYGENEGAGAARNKGLNKATGEYIQYLDADDLLVPGTLLKRINALEQENADVVYCDWQKLEENEPGFFERGGIKKGNHEEIDTDIVTAAIKSFWVPPAAILYTRAITNKIGPWHTDLPIIQDARYIQDAALIGAKFTHVPEVGAYYRVTQTASLSRRNNLAFVQDVYANSKQIQVLLEENNKITPDRSQALADTFDYVSRTLIHHDKDSFSDCIKRIKYLGDKDRNRWPRIVSLLSSIVGYKTTSLVLKIMGK